MDKPRPTKSQTIFLAVAPFPALVFFKFWASTGREPGSRPGRLLTERSMFVMDRVGSLESRLPNFFTIVRRSAGILGIEIAADAAALIAARSRGTPRVANRLLRRVRDEVQVAGSTNITVQAAATALQGLQIDEAGLDATDRKLLTVMIDKFILSPEAALTDVRDGATILIGGFPRPTHTTTTQSNPTTALEDRGGKARAKN